MQLNLKSISVEDVPSRMHLASAGEVTTTKGNFVVDADSATQIKAAMREAGVDLVVDYEHQTLKGVEAPAAGWIKNVEFVAGEGLYASVEWTDHARERIAAKEYRYASPVVNLDETTRRLVSLHSVALTNKPATRGMRPIAAKDSNDADDQPGVPEDDASVQSEDTRMKNQIIGMLALKADASDEDVVAAVRSAHEQAAASGSASAAAQRLTLVCKAAGLDPAEEAGKLEASVMVLAKKAADHDALKARCDALELDARSKAADALILAAKSAGKLVESQEEWARTLILKDKEAFAGWEKSAPVIRPQGKTTSPAQSTGQTQDRAGVITLACKEYDGMDPAYQVLTDKRSLVNDHLREKGLTVLGKDETV